MTGWECSYATCLLPRNTRLKNVFSFLRLYNTTFPPKPPQSELTSTKTTMDHTSPENNDAKHLQNVVVMRHGDRIDNFEPLWITTATRPWDPPLVEAGRLRAFRTGRKLKTNLGFPIHRVFVSPFLRCIQTASEVVSALCAVNDGPDIVSSHGVAIDPSKLKAGVLFFSVFTFTIRQLF